MLSAPTIKNPMPSSGFIIDLQKKINSFYVLTKGTNGVKAKFTVIPWMGSKKKAIWVPKSLVTNLQGPKQVWVPKKN